MLQVLTIDKTHQVGSYVDCGLSFNMCLMRNMNKWLATYSFQRECSVTNMNSAKKGRWKSIAYHHTNTLKNLLMKSSNPYWKLCWTSEKMYFSQFKKKVRQHCTNQQNVPWPQPPQIWTVNGRKMWIIPNKDNCIP